MKEIRKFMYLLALATMAGMTSCGPSDQEASVTISKEGDSMIPVAPNVVVQQPDTTVIAGGTDTIYNDRTVVEHRTDTIVRTVPGETRPAVSPEEMAQIDTWLVANADKLNQYGDPIGSVYTGGTPLFDEVSGTRISKYEYIVRQHPDKPWARQ